MLFVDIVKIYMWILIVDMVKIYMRILLKMLYKNTIFIFFDILGYLLISF